MPRLWRKARDSPSTPTINSPNVFSSRQSASPLPDRPEYGSSRGRPLPSTTTSIPGIVDAGAHKASKEQYRGVKIRKHICVALGYPVAFILKPFGNSVLDIIFWRSTDYAASAVGDTAANADKNSPSPTTMPFPLFLSHLLPPGVLSLFHLLILLFLYKRDMAGIRLVLLLLWCHCVSASVIDSFKRGSSKKGDLQGNNNKNSSNSNENNEDNKASVIKDEDYEALLGYKQVTLLLYQIISIFFTKGSSSSNKGRKGPTLPERAVHLGCTYSIIVYHSFLAIFMLLFIFSSAILSWLQLAIIRITGLPPELVLLFVPSTLYDLIDISIVPIIIAMITLGGTLFRNYDPRVYDYIALLKKIRQAGDQENDEGEDNYDDNDAKLNRNESNSVDATLDTARDDDENPLLPHDGALLLSGLPSANRIASELAMALRERYMTSKYQRSCNSLWRHSVTAFAMYWAMDTPEGDWDLALPRCPSLPLHAHRALALLTQAKGWTPWKLFKNNPNKDQPTLGGGLEQYVAEAGARSAPNDFSPVPIVHLPIDESDDELAARNIPLPWLHGIGGAMNRARLRGVTFDQVVAWFNDDTPAGLTNTKDDSADEMTDVAGDKRTKGRQYNVNEDGTIATAKPLKSLNVWRYDQMLAQYKILAFEKYQEEAYCEEGGDHMKIADAIGLTSSNSNSSLISGYLVKKGADTMSMASTASTDHAYLEPSPRGPKRMTTTIVKVIHYLYKKVVPVVAARDFPMFQTARELTPAEIDYYNIFGEHCNCLFKGRTAKLAEMEREVTARHLSDLERASSPCNDANSDNSNNHIASNEGMSRRGQGRVFMISSAPAANVPLPKSYVRGAIHRHAIIVIEPPAVPGVDYDEQRGLRTIPPPIDIVTISAAAPGGSIPPWVVELGRGESLKVVKIMRDSIYKDAGIKPAPA